MKPLGKDRFQIGRIVVDKRAGTFAVPGRVLVLGQPLEYLVTSPGGMKAYETLLEVDATGSEFNLACILLGLERPSNQPAFQRYSRAPLAGPRAALYIAWSEARRGASSRLRRRCTTRKRASRHHRSNGSTWGRRPRKRELVSPPM